MQKTHADKQTATNASTISQSFFAPANTIQRQEADKVKSTNYPGMNNLDEANKSNIARMNQFSNDGIYFLYFSILLLM